MATIDKTKYFANLTARQFDYALINFKQYLKTIETGRIDDNFTPYGLRTVDIISRNIKLLTPEIQNHLQNNPLYDKAKMRVWVLIRYSVPDVTNDRITYHLIPYKVYTKGGNMQPNYSPPLT